MHCHGRFSARMKATTTARSKAVPADASSTRLPCRNDLGGTHPPTAGGLVRRPTLWAAQASCNGTLALDPPPRWAAPAAYAFAGTRHQVNALAAAATTPDVKAS